MSEEENTIDNARRRSKRADILLAALGPISAVIVGVFSVLGHYYISVVASEQEFANWKEKQEIENFNADTLRQRQLMGEIAELHEKLVVADLEFGIAAELHALGKAFEHYAAEDRNINAELFENTIDELMEELGLATEQQVFAEKAQRRTNLSAELAKKFTEADHYFSDNVVNHAANYRAILYAGSALSVGEALRWQDLVGKSIKNYSRTGRFDKTRFLEGAANLLNREFNRQIEIVSFYNQLYSAMRAEVIAFK